MRKPKQSARNKALAGMFRPTHIAPVQVEDPHTQTAAEFKREYDAQERTKQEAARRARCIALGVQLLSEPSPYLSEGCAPLNTSGKTPEQVCELVRQAFIQFRTELEARDITITDAGINRIASVTKLNWDTMDWTDPQLFHRLYLLMKECDCFQAGDILDLRVNEQPPAEQPAPAPFDMESLNSDIPEQKAQIKNHLEAEYYGNETAKIFSDWQAHIYRTFGVTLDETQQRAAINYFPAANKSFLDGRAWDAMRVTLVNRGILPLTCRTNDEVLCAELENADLNDYETRRKFQQASQRINN